jgi:hypothetical protein
MPQSKRSAQRKRRGKVVLALGAAGLSLYLASNASAAIGGINGAGSAPVSKQVYVAAPTMPMTQTAADITVSRAS